MAAKTQKKVAQEKNLVNVSQSLAEKITTAALINLTNVKSVVAKGFDEISTELSDKLKELKDLRDAVAFEKGNLKILYDVGVEFDQIESIRANNAETMKKLKVELEDDRANASRAFDTFKETLEREEEERKHTNARAQKLDAEKWEDSKKVREATFQKAWDERSAELDHREEEMSSMRIRLDLARTELEELKKAGDAEVKKQVAIVSNSISKDLNNGFALKELGLQNNINLLTREIELLRTNNSELFIQNSNLTESYKEATQKVQQIAEKAVESSARQQTIINTSNETAGQQRK